jgi:hypothetical protein
MNPSINIVRPHGYLLSGEVLEILLFGGCGTPNYSGPSEQASVPVMAAHKKTFQLPRIRLTVEDFLLILTWVKALLNRSLFVGLGKLHH